MSYGEKLRGHAIFLNYLNFKRDLGFVIRSREAKLLEDFLKKWISSIVSTIELTQFHLRQVRNFIIEQKQRKRDTMGRATISQFHAAMVITTARLGILN